MGPYKNGRKPSVLIQKDEEIKNLQEKIQLYIARTSHIQARLLSTIDTLDAIHSSHAEELSLELQAKTRLSQRMNQYANIARAAEIERDDLRDAVVQLVDQVELSHDYSSWPHSRLRVSSFADPVKNPIPSTQLTQVTDQELLAYASRIIESTRRECDAERAAHIRTRELAESRISMLEAQLSRREEELELAVGHLSERFHIPKAGPSRRKNTTSNIPDLQGDTIISLEMTTAARNKALEQEIEGVLRRLENAQLASSELNDELQNFTARSVPVIRDRSPRASPSQHLGRAYPTSDRRYPSETIYSVHESRDPHTPQLLPQENLQLPIDDPDATIRPIPIDAESLNHNQQAIQTLDHQINELASKIDTFTSERKALSQLVVTELRSPAADSQDRHPERVPSIEDDHLRSIRSEPVVHQSVRNSTNNPCDKEKELLETIEQPHRRSSDASLEPKHAAPPAQIPHLLEADEGEISMDLATPLFPTTLVLRHSLSRSQSRSPENDGSPGLTKFFDPVSIPLPPSPPDDFLSSQPTPPPEAIHFILPQEASSSSSLSVLESNLQRVEKTLLEIQGQLNDGEVSLRELRNLLELAIKRDSRGLI